MKQYCTQRRLFLLLFMFILIAVSSQTARAQAPQQGDDSERFVAGKTFVYRNGVWIDTAYDPVQHPLYRIGVFSTEYKALAASLPQLESYRRLGDRLLIVHDGWGIELNESAESGPFVTSETRQPRFLTEYRPGVEPPRRIAAGSGGRPPTLVATATRPDGINISIQISWNELTGLLIVVGLTIAAIWLAARSERAAVQSENLHVGDGQ